MIKQEIQKSFEIAERILKEFETKNIPTYIGMTGLVEALLASAISSEMGKKELIDFISKEFDQYPDTDYSFWKEKKE